MNFTKSKTSKFVAGLLGAAMALSLAFGGSVAPAQAQTTSLQAQIAALQAQLQALMAQAGSSSTTSMMASYTFNTNLKVGSRSQDVLNLQKVLNMHANTQVASSGAGSPGNESMYFGAKTKAAVVAFQIANGIVPASGFVGPLTRATLNQMGSSSSSTTTTTGGTTTTTGTTGGTTTTTTTTTTGTTTAGTTTTTGTTTTAVAGSLAVAAGTQPANSLAPQGAARVPFTTITLTAGSSDVLVNSITVQKAGLGDDAVFSGITLLASNGTQIGIAKTLNSNHQATIGDVGFTVKAGTTQTYTIAGNMAASLANYAGEVIGLSVISVNTAATVSGTLPISGAQQTINSSLAIGTANTAVSSFDPQSSTNQNIGTTGYKFAGIRITAGSAENIRLWSVRWNQSGSASASDLANIVTDVGGVDYPSSVSTDGKYYTATFPGGILIPKGFSQDVYVKGDIIGTGAAGRTIMFDIYKNTDIYLSGDTYMYGVTPTPSPAGSAVPSTRSAGVFTTGNPFYYASQITVTAGTVTTISKGTSIPAQNIANNVPSQPLGGFTTDIKGEPISVQSLVFHFATSTTITQAAAITSITIVDPNGNVVAGPVDATGFATGLQIATFTNTVTFPVGVTTYTIKGKLPGGTTAYANNGTITTSFTPSTDWTTVTGQTTGNTITLPSTLVTMNVMTVKSATLAITVGSTPVAQNIVAGGQARIFANYQLDASQSGEDVRFTSIPLQLTYANGAAGTDLSGCKLWNGSTALNTGSNVVNPGTGASPQANTFTLDQSLTVPHGTVLTLALSCNVSSNASANATYSWGISGSATVSATGVTSSISVTPTITGSAGQTQTLKTGSLTITTDSSSPAYSVVASNTTGNVIGAFRFQANNEAVNLQKIGLKLTNTASSSAQDLVQATIWNGATQIGAVQFTGTNTVATSTLNSPILLPKDTAVVLTIKADVAAVGVGANSVATEGHLIAVDLNNTDTTGTQGTGNDSGNTINLATTGSTGSTAVTGIRIFRSYPIFTYPTTAPTGGNGLFTGKATSGVLIALNVAAPTSGDVTLFKLTFSQSTSTATVTSYSFVGPNGNVSSSTPIINGAGTLATVFFDSVSNTQDKTVSAGTSKTYYLKATVTQTGTNTTGSVSTALKADANFPGTPALTASTTETDTFMASTTALGYANGTGPNSSGAAGGAANIIWSPDSTSTPSATNANDWTNGYGLPGCYTLSGLGQDCPSVNIN
jgi:hypothetical protein